MGGAAPDTDASGLAEIPPRGTVTITWELGGAATLDFSAIRLVYEGPSNYVVPFDT